MRATGLGTIDIYLNLASMNAVASQPISGTEEIGLVDFSGSPFVVPKLKAAREFAERGALT